MTAPDDDDGLDPSLLASAALACFAAEREAQHQAVADAQADHDQADQADDGDALPEH